MCIYCKNALPARGSALFQGLGYLTRSIIYSADNKVESVLQCNATKLDNKVSVLREGKGEMGKLSLYS